MAEYSKVFNSDLEKNYWGIAQGIDHVNDTNFLGVLQLVPGKETIFLSKNAFGRKLVNNLRYVGCGSHFTQKLDVKMFLKKPLESKAPIMPGSDLEAAFEEVKNTMAGINTICGHYCVLLEIVNYYAVKNAELREALKSYTQTPPIVDEKALVEEKNVLNEEKETVETKEEEQVEEPKEEPAPSDEVKFDDGEN